MLNYLRRKSIDDLNLATIDSKNELKRSLNALDLVMLGVGGTIGAGIFVLTGQAAANHAGPAIILSFVLSGIAAALAAFCYAELASMIPVAGSAYTYAYAAFGELVAWLIGWAMVLEFAFGAATVAVGWSGYVNSFLDGIGMPLNPALRAAFTAAPDGGVNLIALLGIAVLSCILYRGIKLSAMVNTVIVVVKVAVILTFIFAAMGHVQEANYTPFMPFGFNGVSTGAAVVFFAYMGFDIVATTAQETNNPQRDVPLGLLGSLAVCTVLYLAVAAVLVGVIPYTELNVPAPIAKALDHINLGFLSPLIKLGAIAGLSTAMMSLLLGQNRIFYAMGRDGLLPQWTASINRFHTPGKTTIVVAFFVSLLAGFLPIKDLSEIVSIGTLFAFTLVCGGVLVMRMRHPNQSRAFKAPLYPWLPLAGAGINAWLMFGLPSITWTYFAIWSTLGLVIYFLYSAKKSGMG